MNVDVTYGIFSFSGNSLLIPFVGREQNLIYYKDKHGQTTSITLDGSVIGTFNEINTARNLILSNFSSDFLPLKIIEDNIVIIEFAKCTVKNVNFSPANYGKADYSIDLECYEESLFTEFFGVLDPKNEFTFSEGENGIVQIDHSISARGFLTSGYSALNNAKNFVNYLSGWYSWKNLYPHFINGIADSNVILTSLSKDVDTTNASYSQTESYLVQTGDIGVAPLIPGVVSEISSSISAGANDPFQKIEINYSIQGGRHTSVEALRASIPGESVLYDLAVDAFGSNDVNSIPVSFSIEDQAEKSKKISISVTYDNDLIAGTDDDISNTVYFDYSATFDTDHLTEITTATIEGEMKTKGKRKYLLASGFLATIRSSSQGLSGYLYEKINDVYTGLYSPSWTLQPIANSISISENELKGTISLQANFSDQDFLSGCSRADYSLRVTPQLRKVVSIPGSNQLGLHGVFDLNTYNLEDIGVNGNLESSSELYKPNFDFNSFLGKSAFLSSNLFNVFVNSNLTPNTQAVLTKDAMTTGASPIPTISFELGFKADKTEVFY